MKRLILAIALLSSVNAYADSDDACAGWLCMPVGYAPPACHPAFIESKRRMLEGKGPLPSFSSCTADKTNPTGIELAIGKAAQGRGIIIGPYCNHRDSGASEPPGCVNTLITYQVMEHGVPLGNMYLRNKQGVDYTYNHETNTFKRVEGSYTPPPSKDQNRNQND